jgi:uncharacterized surface protein with fasciclin (FAS1) repeats
MFHILNNLKSNPMKTRLQQTFGMLVLSFVLIFSSAKAQSTVVDIIVNSPDHSTLETAVIAAKLDDDLSGPGPFTVFAPTNAAFDALPAGTLDALLSDPTGALAQILLYHVASGKVMSSVLTDEQMIKTLQGKKVKVDIIGPDVFINNAKVTVKDLVADNGVVHVIDAVLIPSTLPATVVDIIVNSPDHTTLEAAVVAAGLVETLQGDGTFTVFAPTDAAFNALPAGTLDALLSDPEGQLKQILLYHVAGGNVMSTDLIDNQIITTLQGKKVKVNIVGGEVFINNAKVTVADIKADNGIVHVIDAVLLPSADVVVKETETMGKIITDTYGNSLYFFTKDAFGTSMCIDGCLNNWPVFYVENMEIGAGLDPADFATINRGAGVMQTTYKGWPLYYFTNDSRPGVMLGDGVIGKWFIAKPDYTLMISDNQLTGLNGTRYKGDYTPGDEVIQYFTDEKGLTLYTWKNDKYNLNKFTKSDFSNNAVWPIYEQNKIVLPSILDQADFDVISVFGKDQLTFKGWPLYYFGQDMMVRGNNKGVSVPSPGIWPVAVKDMMMAPAPTTVVDLIVNSPDHTILETAVIAAKLDDDLSGPGPFTVFAPTDDAFNALPAGTLDALLQDPTGDLAQILLYHVASGKVMSTDLSDEQIITTLQGKTVKVDITAEGVFINNAKVTVADLVADNGVVHVIDAVLLPPSPTTVVDIIVNSPDHTILETAVIAAKLDDDLSGTGPFTVFAPTDDAFNALPAGTLDALLQDPTGDLAQILLYHVASGKVMSTDLSDEQIITTLQGKTVKVDITPEGVFINNAKVTVADLVADNGVVHVINAVLLPPAKAAFPINFETTTDAVWSVFENGTGAPDDFMTIPNPDKTGINTSGNVLKFKVNNNALVYAGAVSESYSPVEFTQNSHIITMMVWKSIISPVGFKVEGPINGGPADKEVKVSNTLINQWEKITFDFSSIIGFSYKKIVFFPDFPESRTSGTTAYIDNIEKLDLTAVPRTNVKHNIKVFPNPAVDVLNVTFADAKAEVAIYNSIGLLVESAVFTGKNARFDVSKYAPGLYFVRVNNGSVIKFVK